MDQTTLMTKYLPNLVSQLQETDNNVRSVMLVIDRTVSAPSDVSVFWVDRVGPVTPGEMEKVAAGLGLVNQLVEAFSKTAIESFYAISQAVLNARRELMDIQKEIEANGQGSHRGRSGPAPEDSA